MIALVRQVGALMEEVDAMQEKLQEIELGQPRDAARYDSLRRWRVYLTLVYKMLPGLRLRILPFLNDGSNDGSSWRNLTPGVRVSQLVRHAAAAMGILLSLVRSHMPNMRSSHLCLRPTPSFW